MYNFSMVGNCFVQLSNGWLVLFVGHFWFENNIIRTLPNCLYPCFIIFRVIISKLTYLLLNTCNYVILHCTANVISNEANVANSATYILCSVFPLCQQQQQEESVDIRAAAAAGRVGPRRRLGRGQLSQETDD